MTAKVSKEFKFCAAHRLMLHKGKCSNVHGHTYKVRVTVKGETDASTGMVVDFGELTEIMQPIITKLDHSILLNYCDPLLEDLKHHKVAINMLNGEPTAENIATYILEELILLPSKVIEATVAVKESDTTSAEVAQCY